MRCRPPVFLASLAFAPLVGLLTVNRAFCLTSQDVPAAELPTTNASAGVASTPTPRAVPSPPDLEALPTEDYTAPEPSPGAAAQDDTSGGKYLSNENGSADLE